MLRVEDFNTVCRHFFAPCSDVCGLKGYYWITEYSVILFFLGNDY